MFRNISFSIDSQMLNYTSFQRWRHLDNVAAGPALQAGRDGVADQGEGQHRRLGPPRQGLWVAMRGKQQ